MLYKVIQSFIFFVLEGVGEGFGVVGNLLINRALWVLLAL